MDKASLRHHVRAVLAGLDPAQTALFDAQIASSFFTSQHLMPQSIIGCYMALRGEVSNKSILQTMAGKGHIVCLPVTVSRDLPLIFRQYKPGDKLVRSMLGPMEPVEDAREMIPDVLLVPTLGFNRKCNRLGYGTGLYDRTLAMLRSFKPITAIGVAYSCQEFGEDLPIETHDEALDLIITEKEIIRAS